MLFLRKESASKSFLDVIFLEEFSIGMSRNVEQRVANGKNFVVAGTHGKRTGEVKKIVFFFFYFLNREAKRLIRVLFHFNFNEMGAIVSVGDGAF